MGLIARLIGTEAPKLGVHQFMAALDEHIIGKWTRQNVIDAFGITVPEQTDLDALIAKMVSIPETHSFPGMAGALTNVGTSYDTIPVAKGLGFLRIEGAGITGCEFTVRYNKVGVGTLSWQLWNETAGAEIAVIDDASAAGDNKENTATVTLATPLSPGLRIVRIRCKSTTATDDPVYYGASLRILRKDAIFADVLHRVLLVGETGLGPNITEVLVKTRLGI